MKLLLMNLMSVVRLLVLLLFLAWFVRGCAHFTERWVNTADAEMVQRQQPCK